MTIRTHRHFVCPNGHKGTETTSENDQPYSKQWESVRTNGLIKSESEVNSPAIYVCEVCNQPMTQATQAAQTIDIDSLAQDLGSYGVHANLIAKVRELGRMQAALKELQAYNHNLRVEGNAGLSPTIVKIVDSAFER